MKPISEKNMQLEVEGHCILNTHQKEGESPFCNASIVLHIIQYLYVVLYDGIYAGCCGDGLTAIMDFEIETDDLITVVPLGSAANDYPEFKPPAVPNLNLSGVNIHTNDARALHGK